MSILEGYPLSEDLVGSGGGRRGKEEKQESSHNASLWLSKCLGTHTWTGVYTSVRKVQEEDGLQIKGTSFPLQSLL